MDTKEEPRYPDISDLLQRKAEGRKKLAGLAFGEKIARLEALRERLKPFKRARDRRNGKDNTTG